MANVIIVGAQWGDEGKAKVIDLLAESAEVIVRCQGGSNAGHTVKHGNETYKFHHLPSGLLYGNKICVIGPGTVIQPETLKEELDGLARRGIDTTQIRVSDRAHLTFPYHPLLEQLQESNRATQKIGTTGRGIGPTYMDKVARLGIRVIDLFEPEGILRTKLNQLLFLKENQFAQLDEAHQPTIDWLFAKCQEYYTLLSPYVANTTELIHEQIRQKKHILFEGAQGALLDIDHGTYPYVTSSNATAGGACTGSGVGPTQIDSTVGVMKVYTTRVGEGPFPTELLDEDGQRLVTQGKEIGTTTGRQRRCGWFDAVMSRYSVMINGLNSVAITKLDVFNGFKEVKICTAYKNRVTGMVTTEFPSSLTVLGHMDPVYEVFPGWNDLFMPGVNPDQARYEDFVLEVKDYLARIEALLGIPLIIISVGAERDATIIREHPLKTPSFV